MLPPYATDAHAHVLQPGVQSHVPGARYEPFEAPVQQYRSMLAEAGLGRGVLVNPSTYGSDHTVLLAALRTAPEALRGVAVVPPDVDDETLVEMHAEGVRGCRLQDRFAGGVDVGCLSDLAGRVARLGWHVELWTDLREHLEWLPAAVARCPTAVVFDHFGFLPPEVGVADPAMRELLAMVRDGAAWVTLSGAYRLTPGATERVAAEALTPRVEAFCEAAPGRLLWGTDWPHVAPPGPVPTREDSREVIDLWFPDPELRQQVLVDNPADLYDFPASA